MIPGIYKIFEHWHNKGTLFVFSDPHFDDPEQNQLEPNRPSSEEIVRLINSKVGKTDRIICLGDVGNPEWMKKIRGYKILIAGNHDAGMSNYEEYFDEIYSGPLIIGEKLILSHEPVDVPWAMNICGHDHSGWNTKDGRHLNACLNRNNYLPLNLNQLMKNGLTSKIESIHRACINNATKRSKKKR